MSIIWGGGRPMHMCIMGSARFRLEGGGGHDDDGGLLATAQNGI